MKETISKVKRQPSEWERIYKELLDGRRGGWDVLREQHWNKYTIKGETDHQPRWDAWDKCSGLVHWEDSEGWDGEGGESGDQDGEDM